MKSRIQYQVPSARFVKLASCRWPVKRLSTVTSVTLPINRRASEGSTMEAIQVQSSEDSDTLRPEVLSQALIGNRQRATNN